MFALRSRGVEVQVSLWYFIKVGLALSGARNVGEIANSIHEFEAICPLVLHSTTMMGYFSLKDVFALQL